MGMRFQVMRRALMVLAVVMPAVAQAQSEIPEPTLQRAPPVWLGYLIMVVLLVIVLGVSLMPSKRGHQD